MIKITKRTGFKPDRLFCKILFFITLVYFAGMLTLGFFYEVDWARTFIFTFFLIFLIFIFGLYPLPEEAEG